MAPTANPNVLATQTPTDVPDIPVVNPTPQPTAIVSQPAPVLPPPPKQTFAEGFRSGGTPTYTTDAEGNIINAAPARRASTGGILGQILRGALEGANRGMGATTPEGARGAGAAASAGAKAAEEGRIAADQRAKALAQQNFENQQKATQAKLEHNLMIAQTRDLIMKSQHEEAEFPLRMKEYRIEVEEHQIALKNADDQRRQTQADLIAALEAHNVHPYASVTQTPQGGKNMAGQAIQHVPAMVNGKALPVQNGKIGAQNGAVLFSTEDLNQPVTGDPIKVPYYDGTKDDKGKFVPHYRMIVPDGKTTYGDIARQFMAADGQLKTYQAKEAADMANQAKAADIRESKARAAHEEAGAELERQEAAHPELFHPGVFGSITGDQTKSGKDYLASLPVAQQNLFKAVYEGRIPLGGANGLGYLAARQAPMLEAITKAFPDFDASRVPQYIKTYEDFTSGKTSQALYQKGANAIQHLWNLEQLNTIGSRMPGSKAAHAYTNQLNTLIGELSAFYGVPETDKNLQAAKETLDFPVNRESAIKTQAASMIVAFGNYGQRWKNAAPSPAYEAKMPQLNDDAKKAIGHFAPDFFQNHPLFAPPQPPAPPKVGDTKIFPNGAVGVWDGQGYAQKQGLQ